MGWEINPYNQSNPAASFDALQASGYAPTPGTRAWYLDSGTLREAEYNGTAWVELARYAALVGKIWDLRRSAADNNWLSVCLHPPTGRLVAVSETGIGNRVMTSDDGGITWTIRTSAADNNWISVCLHPPTGRLVAVAVSGTGNRVMTSEYR